MKKIILPFLAFVFITSCSDENTIDEVNKTSQTEISLKNINSEMRAKFGRALVKALGDNVGLRSFIKAKALKMFDKDYDVLYALIKDEKLESGLTFGETLEKYFDNPSDLDRIESAIPLLTIFVPELPNESFSAKTWDTSNQIPKVGVAFNHTNDVLMLDYQEEDFTLESKYVPSYPVIVVKECERMIANTQMGYTDAKGSKTFESSKFTFKFLDNVFDNSAPQKRIHARIVRNNGNVTFSSIDQKVVDSYNIYNGTDGWHRDYIYYNISPNSDRGPMLYDFKEHITSFRMDGDPMLAYYKISDQAGEPQIRTTTTSANSGWTGGGFEFKIRVLFNAKNGLGSEFITYLPMLPTNLFDLTYTQAGLYYVLSSVATKEYWCNVPLFSWDLNEYASTVKIEIEEVDLTETTTITDTRTVKFATNFSIDATVLKKVGLKFGASLESTNTSTISKTFTQGNDQLGSVIVNFADKIITSFQSSPTLGGTMESYITREYPSGGYFVITVEPKKVQ